MVTVTRKSVAELLLADSLAEAHLLRQRCASFERKYGGDVESVEKRLQTENA